MSIMIIVLIVMLSVLTGYLYRLGGSNVNTRPSFLRWKPRDVLCNLVSLLAVYLVGIRGEWWAWVLVFGITWGALSSYHDYISGKDNFWLHGFFIGLALFPLVIWGTLSWQLLLFRAFVLAIFMGVWCLLWGWDLAEEWGRGASLPLSLAIFLI